MIRVYIYRFACVWACVVFGTPLVSGQVSLLGDGFGARQALIPVSVPAGQDAHAKPASLFADRAVRGLFGPTPVRLQVDPVAALSAAPVVPLGNALGVAGLRDLIAKAEAGPAGYNAVVWSAKIKPPKAPTDMTIAEIYKWIKDTPNQNHAIGRYQFIPKTLRYLVHKLGLPHNTRFSPHIQDQLANVLLEGAGFSDFRKGKVSQKTFMNNLAKVWAGLPTSNGKSFYHGKAGNKAVLSWARFEREMARIFPS